MDKIRTFRDKLKQEYQFSNISDQEIQSETIWNTLHEFGITKNDIMKQNLTPQELYEIHCAAKTYEECKKVLRDIEQHS